MRSYPWSNGAVFRFIGMWAICVFGAIGAEYTPYWPYLLGGALCTIGTYATRDMQGVVTWCGLFNYEAVDRFFDDDAFWYFVSRCLAAIVFALFFPIFLGIGLLMREDERINDEHDAKNAETMQRHWDQMSPGARRLVETWDGDDPPPLPLDYKRKS